MDCWFTIRNQWNIEKIHSGRHPHLMQMMMEDMHFHQMLRRIVMFIRKRCPILLHRSTGAASSSQMYASASSSHRNTGEDDHILTLLFLGPHSDIYRSVAACELVYQILMERNIRVTLDHCTMEKYPARCRCNDCEWDMLGTYAKTQILSLWDWAMKMERPAYH